MKISIIIPAFNEEAYIGQCIESVIKELNLYKKSSENRFEIIVIDNASSDNTHGVASDTLQKLHALGNTIQYKVILESKKGTGNARQRGYLEASGDILAFIDADTIIPTGWIHSIKKVFENDIKKKIASISGPYKYYDGSWINKRILGLMWILTAPLTRLIVGYMILFGNVAMRKEMVDAMGGLNTDIAFYGDDTDTAKRLSKYGKTLFKMNFFVYSSMRRFKNQGMIKIMFLYAINFAWIVFFQKPFSKHG